MYLDLDELETLSSALSIALGECGAEEDARYTAVAEKIHAEQRRQRSYLQPRGGRIPTTEEVGGSDPNFTGGLSTEAFLRKSRGE